MEEITSPQQEYDSLRYVSAETPCPYLPHKMSRSEAYRVDQLSGSVYENLLARGFRRSGRIVYRPRCRSCDACRQLRVPIADFSVSRSMSRVLRRNKDLHIQVDKPQATPQKHEMFRAYLNHQHDDTMDRGYDSFVDFLYDTPTETLEIAYLLEGKLIGISIVDRLPQGLSSVYMFFDPQHRQRSLGTFSALWEIDYCRRKQLDYYYLGYYIAECDTMSYKGRFRPNEVLVGDNRWLTFRQ